jgi:hypothetical protein
MTIEREDAPFPAPLWRPKGMPRAHLSLALCPECGEPVAGVFDHDCMTDLSPKMSREG